MDFCNWLKNNLKNKLMLTFNIEKYIDNLVSTLTIWKVNRDLYPNEYRDYQYQ